MPVPKMTREQGFGNAGGVERAGEVEALVGQIDLFDIEGEFVETGGDAGEGEGEWGDVVG